MTTQMRLVINGKDVSIPRDMAGRAAAALACSQLGITEPDMRLRRLSGEWVGDAVAVGEVLQDGDELELATA